MDVHPSAHRLLDALVITAKVDGHAEPGKVASLLGESPATITNWKSRGVSKAGALKAAELFQINPVWIRTGEGRMTQGVTTIPQVGDTEAGRSNVLLVGLNKRVPRLAWHEVQPFIQGMFTPTADRYEVVTARNVTDRCFLLEVSGDAMAGPIPDESFPHGSLLVCDPDQEPQPGQLVIALHPKSGEPVFRRLVLDGGVWFLKASNPAYPLVEIDGPSAIIARVIRTTIERDV